MGCRHGLNCRRVSRLIKRFAVALRVAPAAANEIGSRCADFGKAAVAATAERPPNCGCQASRSPPSLSPSGARITASIEAEVAVHLPRSVASPSPSKSAGNVGVTAKCGRVRHFLCDSPSKLLIRTFRYQTSLPWSCNTTWPRRFTPNFFQAANLLAATRRFQSALPSW